MIFLWGFKGTRRFLMNASIMKIIVLVGILIVGAGCSSSESLREKYISSDLRKAQELAQKKQKLNRKVSSHYFIKGSLPL
ncbi:MAG: hypothetical protein ACJAT2_002372 [Bacteriovoracaceae bacterium]|jgi:hypothetical protein